MSRIIRLSVAFILGFTFLVTATPAQAATTHRAAQAPR
jgi:snapalysin